MAKTPKWKADGGGDKRSKAERKAEVREKKARLRKNYALVQEIVFIWEKLRPREVTAEQRGKLVTLVLSKVRGRVLDLVTNHRASRVIQFCLKYGSDVQRRQILEEVRPNVLELAKNKYGHHLVQKLVNKSPREDLPKLARLFEGHVPSLLKHQFGCDVINDLYFVADRRLKGLLLRGCYSKRFAMALEAEGEGGAGVKGRADDSLGKLLTEESGFKRAHIMQDLYNLVHPVIEKGLVHGPMMHKLIVEYLLNAPSAFVEEVVQTMAEVGDAVMKMVHTREGARASAMVVAYGTPKTRKAVVRNFKGYVREVAMDEWGSTVLATVLDRVDDTALTKKVVVPEVRKCLGELLLDRCGRRVVLNLLNPGSSLYWPPHLLKIMHPPERKLESRHKSMPGAADDLDLDDADVDGDGGNADGGAGSAEKLVERLLGVSKKDSYVRRQEVLGHGKDSLSEAIISQCLSNMGTLLRSPFGADAIAEVATGGVDGILTDCSPEGVQKIHEAVFELCAQPRPVAVPAADGENVEDAGVGASDASTGGKVVGGIPVVRTGQRKKPIVGDAMGGCDSGSEDGDSSESMPNDGSEEDDDDFQTAHEDFDEDLGVMDDEFPVHNDANESGKCSPPNRHPLDDLYASRALRRMVAASAVNGIRGACARDVVSGLWLRCFQGRCSEWVGSPAKHILSALLHCGCPAVVEACAKEMKPLVSVPLEKWSAELKASMGKRKGKDGGGTKKPNS
ncbi:unnamed protein product [Ostreobium quekettii]|uniref:PUM-HD domain-containing protein n=1 Tax=Ostreobium quekettii TaxID=121088 RepID=A0A8S1IZK4_9CHLO|nr:unnamed protein product [Ostreobium quekettii]